MRRAPLGLRASNFEKAQIASQLQPAGVALFYDELGVLCNLRSYFATYLFKYCTLVELRIERVDAAEERARFLGVFEQIELSMSYTQVRDVIHRELKTSIIMVGSFGET